MTKPSLKLLFLRKYRTSKKYYRQLRLPSAIAGTTLTFSGVFSSGNRENEAGHGNNNRGNSSDSNRQCYSNSSTTSRVGPLSSGRRPTGYVSIASSVATKPGDSVDCCVLIYDCISQCRLRTFVFILVAGIISTAGLYWHNQRFLQYRLNIINNDTPKTTTVTSTKEPSTKNVDYSDPLDPSTTRKSISSHDHHALPRVVYRFHQHVDPLYVHDDPRVQQNSNHVPNLNDRVYRQDVFSPQHGIRLKRCTIPVLKPLSAEVKKFIGYTDRPNCAKEQNDAFSGKVPFSIRNGTMLVRNPEVDAAKTKGCCYRPFHRNGDNDYWSSNQCIEITEEITQIHDEILYMELLCISSATQTDFRDGFALTHKRDQVEGRVETFESTHETSSLFSQQDNRLSVMVLGLDATSHMNFIRALPKSNKYLLRTMSAVALNGYTKVAENTLPNVVPLLTGRTLEEFKQECVDESGGGGEVHLDGCPFIWKVFADNGYRTGLAEDDVDIGIFNMNWGNAFERPPTDYYLRPLSHLMQNRHNFRNGYCYGPRLSFDKLLDNMKSMAEVFQDQTYFQFTWATKLSHDDFNKLRWGDDSLLELLQYLHTGKYLNNTALLIIGDHGSRLDKIRSTAQGKLEDRMPVAYFVLPKWFKIKYHGAYRNLKKNAYRIASAFDVHKTLYNFLNLDSLLKLNDKPEYETDNGNGIEDNDVIILPNQTKVSLDQYRGVSLFTELPENRTCFAAGIPLHWCVCHTKIPLDKEATMVEAAAEFVVASLNALLNDVKSCSALLLQSIDEVSKWDSREIIRDGCNIIDDHRGDSGKSHNTSVVTNLNHSNNTNSTSDTSAVKSLRQNDTWICNESESEVVVLQVAFTTTPGDATFETTVIQLPSGTWRLTEDVVRTNSYEGQSWCVEQKLKPYCNCEDGDEDSFMNGWFR